MSLAQWSAVRPTPLHWAFVLPLAYGVLSLAWAPAIHPWVLQQLAILFAGYVIGYYFDVRHVVIPLALATAGFFAWAAWLSPITFNPMILGEMAVLVLIALVVERLYWLAPLMVPTIALSHSRGVFACLALGLVATFYRRPLGILCALLAASLAFLYFAGPTDVIRIRIWAAAIDYLRPWGNGLGSFRDLYLTLNGVSWHPVEVHNDALQLVFELGLAAVPLLWFFTIALTRPGAAHWPTLLTFLFMGTFSFPLYTPLTALVGALALGSAAYYGDQLCENLA